MKIAVRFALLALVTGAASHNVSRAGSLAVTAPEDVGMSSERLERLLPILERRLDEGRTGGFQVLVARRGKVVMHENVGMADIEAGRRVDHETLFKIASMTKPVIGVAMMMLYEEGYYSLQDPVSQHIPELSDLKVYAGADEAGQPLLREPAREPTIHDLMQHTAGLTYGIFGDTPVDRLYNQAGVLNPANTQQEFIDTLASLPLLFDPGERWNYSVATDVQGYLIEKWTGMDLDRFLRERIFEPLGMDETMSWVRPGESHNLAAYYTHDASGELVPVREFSILGAPTRRPARFSGGAQLISTSDDYWRFCQMLLNGGVLDGVRLLSPSSVEMMRQNRLDGTVTVPGWFVEQGFGLNFAVITDPAKIDFPVTEGEYFWAGATTTVFWIDPANEIIAILLTQYTPFEIGEYSDLLHRFVNSAIID